MDPVYQRIHTFCTCLFKYQQNDNEISDIEKKVCQFENNEVIDIEKQ
jgi:hypothetical protein